MDLEALSKSPIGVLVPISGHDPRRGRDYQYSAFLPADLPRDLDLEQGTWRSVTAASQSIARLDRASRQIPNPALIRHPLLRREAVSTTALEGTYAAFTDVLEADVTEESTARSPEVQEVLNYVFAAEFAYEAIENSRPISVGLLCDLQCRLIRGTRTDGRDTGSVRTTPVIIGPDGCNIEEARFVPPPADDRLHAGLRAWEAWLADPPPLPAIARAALAHYQLEALHPFHDGNGRIGRLVIVLQLMIDGELSEPLLEVSPWFESRRREYQSQLLDLSVSGDFDRWIRFFCAGLGAQAASAVVRIDRLLDVHAQIIEKVRAAGLRGLAVQIAEGLVGRPYVRPAAAARQFSVTYPAANTAVRRLESIGVLREQTGRSYDRIFAAPLVIEALS